MRERTAFLWLGLVTVGVLLASALQAAVVPGRPPPGPRPAVWPTATPTPTATPGWWEDLPMATPTWPALPGLPTPGWSGRPEGGGRGPVPFQPQHCPGPEARITAIERQGVWWLIRGVAAVDPFWYWKAELSADGTGWTLLYRGQAPVVDGPLLEFHTGTVSPGDYLLRVVAVRQDGNYPTPCTVRVTVP